MPEDYPWSNNELIINELYTEEQPAHPGGRKPKPVKSNWMMRERQLPPARKTVVKHFIDDLLTGETLCETIDEDAGYELVAKFKKQGLRTCLRTETFNEQRMQDETRAEYRARGYQKGFGG